ncbi:FecR family protein [Sphingobacterium psychroaquaticum]|uniref:FecR family protein n=1 Tax=Sphingobacterium psychroaquaticum TaxID=561061 RepID=UPI00106A0E22|nr:FecR family protein [Sphingobacterium psychroaquaticum]QBQ40940.1 FecR family protein [Sphingobacterium psychroaquaticum]
MNNKLKFEDLYTKYLQGQLTAEELLEFIQQSNDPANEATFSELVNETFHTDKSASDAFHTGQAFQRFQSTIKGLQAPEETHPQIRKQKRSYGQIWKYIAAACMVSCFIYLGSNYFRESKPTHPYPTYSHMEEVQPGTNKAFLKTADGKEIALGAEGALRVENNRLIDATGEQIQNEDNTNTWQTLVVPTGGQYKMILADGSKVWLNSASKMTFTKQFNGSKRIIKLEGEAYFEVAHNAQKPFIVESNEQQVQVLGTKFNLSAYPDEATVTTLVAGKVNVSAFGQNETLIPGMQSINSASHLTTKPANMEVALAWMNDRFVFVREPLPQIIQKLSRWYNVDMYIASGSEALNKKTFSGSLSRNTPLTEILNLFKTTETIRFEMKEGRVRLMM